MVRNTNTCRETAWMAVLFSHTYGDAGRTSWGSQHCFFSEPLEPSFTTKAKTDNALISWELPHPDRPRSSNKVNTGLVTRNSSQDWGSGLELLEFSSVRKRIAHRWGHVRGIQVVPPQEQNFLVRRTNPWMKTGNKSGKEIKNKREGCICFLHRLRTVT